MGARNDLDPRARHRPAAELGGRVARSLTRTWSLLAFEQRAAAVGAILLIVSTFGPFSFVEAAIVLTALAVLTLLHERAQGRDFDVPFGDGAVIAAAGLWSAVLIFTRIFSRPLGQGLLALVCAAILVVAGVRERGRRPQAGGATGGPVPAPAGPDGPAPAPAPARRPRRPARQLAIDFDDPPTFDARPPRGREDSSSPPAADASAPPPATAAGRHASDAPTVPLASIEDAASRETESSTGHPSGR